MATSLGASANSKEALQAGICLETPSTVDSSSATSTENVPKQSKKELVNYENSLKTPTEFNDMRGCLSRTYSPMETLSTGSEKSDSYLARTMPELTKYGDMGTSMDVGKRSEKRKNAFFDYYGESGRWKVFTDPRIPFVLSLYLQLLFNIVIVAILMYLLYLFVDTIGTDINNKVENYVSDISEEIALCAREYERNRCYLEHNRAPAIERTCTHWKKCMSRNPHLLGKSKLTAETFADIINGFVRPISWKALIILALISFGSLFVTNFAFGCYRNTSEYKSLENDKLRDRVKICEKKFYEVNLALSESNATNLNLISSKDAEKEKIL